MLHKGYNRCPCGKCASFALPGERPKSCAFCRTEDMINVTVTYCVSCGLFTSQKKYDWYCFDCYCWKFPDKKIARRRKTKESAINELIKEAFPHTKFVNDKIIAGCSKRRPDWYIDLYTHFFIIECDEHQHKHYGESCEEARLGEIFEDIAYRPLVVLRFNLDKYKNSAGETVRGCFPGRTTKANAQLRSRFEVLRKEIEHHLNNIPKTMFVEKKFFFDEK